MVELLASVQDARSVANFVEAGELAEALANLRTKGASDEPNKTSYSEDNKTQVQAALTHLEAVESALSKTLKKYGSVLQTFRPARCDFLVDKRRYVLALMALCYRYLGDKELTERACTEIATTEAPQGWYPGASYLHTHHSASGFSDLLALPDLYWQVKVNKWEKYQYDRSDFIACLRATWKERSQELSTF
jgi:hypothetical protein